MRYFRHESGGFQIVFWSFDVNGMFAIRIRANIKNALIRMLHPGYVGYFFISRWQCRQFFSTGLNPYIKKAGGFPICILDGKGTQTPARPCH